MSFTDRLAELKNLNLLRRRRLIATPCGPEMLVDGRPALSFASNDYLGFAHHPRLIDAAARGLSTWGVGAGASEFLGGHFTPNRELETKLAEFVGAQKALHFATGYMANIGIVPALAERGDAIFADKLNHASLIDAVRLSLAFNHRYPHLDLGVLEGQLSANRAKRRLIVTDAVFSMDGDIAPLPELMAIAERHDALLLIDDAHGFGVLGPQGRGSAAHFGLKPGGRLIVMATLGKAAGVSGAFVAGDADAIDWLEQSARTAIYTTGVPPALTFALQESLKLIEAGDELRNHLQTLIARLRAGLQPICARAGWRLTDSATAIQPVVIGGNEATLNVADALLERGIWAPAIRPPTVPEGQARLRISLSASHGEMQVDELVAALGEIAS
ncbi:MAG: 8-amino-7-oxononanoate synthase [Gammaproteobacteria bacterium]|nr:8-amino-7-oxononanoate synthase [Gammaproteobacteria bacterium]MBU1415305.1 8-amino-7-oxononanoate synthase [Gammaproteobacteria bacterium]